MKSLIICSSFILTLVSSAIFAHIPTVSNHGHKHPHVGSTNTGKWVPPGLHNKSTPHGLKMKNKTPGGWSKGHKNKR